MAVNEIMLELIDELTDAGEITLDANIEDIIDDEIDAIDGDAEIDDDLIEFIATGQKMAYENAINFFDLMGGK